MRVADVGHAGPSPRPTVLIGARGDGQPEGDGERLRSGLESMGIEVVAVRGSVCDLVRQAQACRPGIAVVSTAIRGNPLAAVADLCALGYPIAVVVLGPDDEAEALAALSAGAVGYLPPDLPMPALARALCAVARGEAAVPHHLVRQLLDAYQHRHHHCLDLPGSDRRADLTEREWEVLQLLWQGRSTGEIADRLFVSTSTVRTHIGTVARKLGVRSRQDLCRLVEDRSRMSTSSRLGPALSR